VRKESKNDTQQVASKVLIDDGRRSISNLNAKEEDMSTEQRPGDVLQVISSYQLLCENLKDEPHVSPKEQQAVSTVGASGISATEIIDEAPCVGNTNAKEEDITMVRHPGDLLITSYQALSDDEKDWPNVEAKEPCGFQVMLYFHISLTRPTIFDWGNIENPRSGNH
jgi:hypothetical protein